MKNNILTWLWSNNPKSFQKYQYESNEIDPGQSAVLHWCTLSSLRHRFARILKGICLGIQTNWNCSIIPAWALSSDPRELYRFWTQHLHLHLQPDVSTTSLSASLPLWTHQGQSNSLLHQRSAKSIRCWEMFHQLVILPKFYCSLSVLSVEVLDMLIPSQQLIYSH